MTKYTIEEMKAMLEMGFTHEQIVAMSNEPVATVGSKPSKTSKAKAPKKATGAKAPSKSKGKNEWEDRDLYEAVARKLGCFSEAYGVVVATVENGKVIRNRQQNREMVYAEMAKLK